MNRLTDQELLRDYAERRSEAAFAELVRRYVDLVYSAALRMVRDAHLAKDVAQGVFLALAQGAGQLTKCAVLPGWLHRTARNLAANAVRCDVRRRTREQEAAAMNEVIASEPGTAWEQVAPQLDSLLGELNDADRDALLLRYFQRRTAREMAQTLGVSEEAAQKRVTRALARLRQLFAQRGIAVGEGGLAVALSANAVQGAPGGLAATISAAAALAGGAVHSPTIIAATKAIAMTSMHKLLIAAAFVAMLGTGVYEAHQASRLGSQVRGLQQQQASDAEQVLQLSLERDQAAGQLAALRDGSRQPDGTSAELLKLRGEVARLRQDSLELARLKAGGSADPTDLAAQSWLKRVSQLKQRLEETPQAKIPELQFLDAFDWVELAHNFKLETEADYRKALGEVRKRAEGYFTKRFQSALGRYMAANNGQWPPDLSQLKPFFDPSVDDAILQRWQIVPKSALPNQEFAGDWVLTEKAPVDEEYDHRWTIDGPGSGGVGPYHHQPSAAETELQTLIDSAGPMVKQYSVKHGGREPSDPSQLQPYATNPAQQAVLARLLQIQATNAPGR